MNESTFLDTANADLNFGDTYAIDNKQYSIAQTDKLKVEALSAYKAGIEKRMESLFEDISYLRKGQVAVTEYSYPSVSEVIEAVKETCQYELKGRQCLRVMEGMVIGLFNIGNVGAKAAAEVKNMMGGLMDRDWKEVWSHGLDEIVLDYFEELSDLISSNLDFKYKEDLRWVLKSHLFSHVLGKHLVECPESTHLLEELKAEEDSGSGMVSTKSAAKPKPTMPSPNPSAGPS